MKNNVYKIILITMIALVSMIIAASANTATIDGTYNEGVVTRCDLCAVLPVYLVTVVLSWVMACCKHDTGYTS